MTRGWRDAAGEGACEHVRLDLGAYALDAMPPAERRAVDAHLRDCPACAAELADLEDTVSALGQLSPADLPSADLLPTPDLFDRVVAAIDAEVHPARDHRRRRPLGLVAAAAVVVLVAGVSVAAIHHGPSHPTFSASTGPVRMSAQVQDQPGGSALVLDVSGLPKDELCRLYAISRAGVREAAGSWAASYDGAARVVETTTFSAAELARLELDGTDGAPLVTVRT